MPLAYHFAWTTYGTWLPGDPRGWFSKDVAGLQHADPQIAITARARMKEQSVTLTKHQRELVEKTIADHCQIRGWTLHAVNARTNHLHAIISADCKPDVIRDQLKAWTSRKLSDDLNLNARPDSKSGRKKWWSEGGDPEVIDDPDYLENAIEYVMDGQGDK